MEWTGLNEIREKFLCFYESKAHTRLPSYPLVPQGDNSLLLINSGMAPLKKFFLGQETPPNKRVTTCQKCIRTPDIERVGKTARHGTYFEMLGNFSFGDYFKHEATRWAWEFCTEVMKLPVDKIWISIYEDDEETKNIWVNEVGVDPSRIVKLGKEDNFWEIGAGPCGPCSELYFDRGIEHGCKSPDCKVGCECDRFVEFWNLVFSQFDNDGNGNYVQLKKPNIDTGMGLERLACIMQNVDNLFEIDTVQNIMNHICKIAGISYKSNPESDVSLRVITDHIRSTTFMIADGVMPSNEGRGYVLRRLLRRAARHGHLLGVKEPFLYKVVNTVVNENKSAYPELEEKASYIKKLIKNEEENFHKTIDKGFDMLNHLIDDIDVEGIESQRILSGQDAFKLYDTFGFPIDLTREIILERNMQVDEEEFKKLMDEQRKRARDARLSGDAVAWSDENLNLGNIPTKFVGYDESSCCAKVLAIICDSQRVETAINPQTVTIITDVSCFYAESGGQVSDKGQITSDACEISIFDVQKTSNGFYMHHGSVSSGHINVGDTVQLQIDKSIRRAITRNHTAAHLLQAALRKVLGDHVHQAGQLVNAMRLRFDFSHFEALSAEQIKEIETYVNRIILSGIDVDRYETDIKTAKANGAMALFGEKYGNIVRVCDVKGYSMELCGGTHVKNTGNVGLFKIVSECSVAAGVRRIEAVTGYGVLELLNETSLTLTKSASELKITNPTELVARCTGLMSELKAKSQEIALLNQKIADTQIQNLFENLKDVNGIYYITAMFSNMSPDSLRVIGDRIKNKAPRCVGLIAGSNEGKSNFLCVCGKEAVEKGADAGKIVAMAAQIAGGKGGGRVDTAMAGIKDKYKIDEALDMLPKFIETITSK
ncbi:MAG: alanine--tRNA ligase [Oscillospiraceae bacterium]